MKKQSNYDACCALCEHSEDIFQGDYCICKKKGVTEPNQRCRAFCFDPLKIKVSVRKLPKFQPIPNLFSSDEKK